MTFALLDMVLAAAVGFLLATLLIRRAKSKKESAKNKPVAKMLALFMEPIYFWLDLKGPDGRPSHSKIAYLVALVVALYGLLAFGQQQTVGLDLGYITYVVVVLAYALGKQVFNTILKFIVARFPGAEARVQKLTNGERNGEIIGPHHRPRRRASDSYETESEEGFDGSAD